MGTGLHFQLIRDRKIECLPSGFFSICLKEAIPIMNERGECGVPRLFLYLHVNWTPVSHDWGPVLSRSD